MPSRLEAWRICTVVSIVTNAARQAQRATPIVIVLAMMCSRPAALIVALRASWLATHKNARAGAQSKVKAINPHLRRRGF